MEYMSGNPEASLERSQIRQTPNKMPDEKGIYKDVRANDVHWCISIRPPAAIAATLMHATPNRCARATHKKS
ncbi:hypothetical protein EVAR_69318_1 [Eumeta japonica]|uniref:Uncharacterized protein n=1 Tax=Eumeta variegata TaxID=151549 RepID=A0A4C2A258_EUMVA|nr:hypothetical protein EVAR_69318_1 [Eumeta japonica]